MRWDGKDFLTTYSFSVITLVVGNSPGITKLLEGYPELTNNTVMTFSLGLEVEARAVRSVSPIHQLPMNQGVAVFELTDLGAIFLLLRQD